MLSTHVPEAGTLMHRPSVYRLIQFCRGMIRGMILLLILWTAGTPVFSQDSSPPTPAESTPPPAHGDTDVQNSIPIPAPSPVTTIEEQLLAAGYAVFRDESIPRAVTALNRSREALDELAGSVTKDHPVVSYYESRIMLNRGFVLMSSGDNREAQSFLEKSIRLSEDALEQIEDDLRTMGLENWEHELPIPALPTGREIHSDLWRVLSDSYMYLFNFKGTLYQMSNGAKLRDYPRKALELNPGNLRALLSRGLFFIKAPAIGGGNNGRGIEVLQQLASSGNELLAFQAYAWIGSAQLENGNGPEAEEAFHAAQRIFPNTAWIAGLRRGERSQGR